MRVLLLGGSGMLGRDLLATAPARFEVDAPSSRDLDITDRTAVRAALNRFRPDTVINAAAYTHVDRAEREAEAAHRVNADAVGELAAECASRAVRLLHYSTDYVFSGETRRPYHEEDPVAPVSVYGRTKAAGERAVRASGAQALIIRTSWLYGLHGRSFPRTMWDRAASRAITRVVNDQYGRPTSSADLAIASWKLVASEHSGIVHATGSGPGATWFDVARCVFERAGAPELLTACSTGEYPAPATRPAWSVLATDRLEALVGGLPDWRDSLRRFLGELEAAR